MRCWHHHIDSSPVAATHIFGAGEASPKSEPDADRRAHREQFSGGSSDRDTRSGEEMKPRW
ncbi:entry exclusion protein TrbK [Tianweitania sp. Rool2]|uniref:Entry exclusion protein TrbK n=1 Tax=Oryzicola mucosus TaxID=2767425 RepID=A0A8J6U5S0_9HYPH|nr:entry exclusion protein TrbK [Oryzicola mucosus]